ncbi:MAG: hypothetical protein KKD44_25755 [Proteobacteria bacterium]|nr:hypothetical protein [Pseudomonadota bacterium]
MVSIIALKRKRQGICLVELITTVMRLRLIVYTYNIESRPLVSFRSTTGSTE